MRTRRQLEQASFNRRRANKREKEANTRDAMMMTRRDLLLGLAAIAGGGVAAGVLEGKKKFDKLMKPVETIAARREEVTPSQAKAEETAGTEEVEIEEEYAQPTPEQIKIEEADARSIREVINYNKEGRLRFNTETVNSIKVHSKKRYREEPAMRESLEKAYWEMGKWLPGITEQFRLAGVPEKFVYLAIPESHWNLDAVSEKGATGPYQFTASTAAFPICNLKKDKYIDERNHVEKSARACANLLKDNYEKCGHDWDLALSVYNGRFAWKYVGQAKARHEQVSYENYLPVAEKKINEIRDSIKYGKSFTHEAFRGQKIIDLAKGYGVSVKQIMEANHMKRIVPLKKDQLVRIPISDKNRLQAYKFATDGFSENLLYPAKFNAVMELINERFVTKQAEPHTPKYITVPGKAGTELTLAQIAPKIGVSAQKLLELNPELRQRKDNKVIKIKGPLVKRLKPVKNPNRVYAQAGYQLRT